jgi:ubiquinone/menaquinone biosynthesis C-methylase UbiE
LDDPKQIVARGYDAIALRYAEWAASFQAPTMEWVRDLLERLEPGSNVLELGCGRGVPATRELAKRHRVTGVDISGSQIALARHHVPEATFIHADATELDLRDASFDAVVALYMLGHVPRAEQSPLLERIARWLRPGAWFLGTMGTSGTDDMVEEDWLGAPMFFASFDPETNRGLLGDAGLTIERDRVIPIEEPGHGIVSFMWILARKPA